MEPDRHHPIMELPVEALDLVLQRVPLRCRLHSCAPVCTSWASAVAAIPVHASTTIYNAGSKTALQESLDQCGSVNGQLVSLNVFNASDYWDPLLQLPCCQLQHLRSLSLSHLQLGLWAQPCNRIGSSGSTGGYAWTPARIIEHALACRSAADDHAAAPVLPKLQELQLDSGSIPIGSLLVLSRVTTLTCLKLDTVRVLPSFVATETVSSAELGGALSKVLGQLPNLERLVLKNMSAALLQLSTMQRLQHLHVSALWDDAEDGIRPADLAHLPLSLTALQLLRFAPDSELTPSTAPRMGQLRKLKVLQLSEVCLNAQLLNQMTGLPELSLEDVSPAQADQHMTSARRPVAAGKKAGKAADSQHSQHALLEAIGRMPQLRDLKLKSCQLHECSNLECFAALTASKQLTALNICQWRDQPLPVGALPYMLPAGKQLLQLEVLTLHAGLQQPAAAAASTSAADAIGTVGSTGSSSEGVLDACDVFRIADAFPALRALRLSHVLRGVAGLPGVMQGSGPNCCSLNLETKPQKSIWEQLQAVPS